MKPTTLVQRLKRPYTAAAVNYLQNYKMLEHYATAVPLGGFTDAEIRRLSAFFRFDAMNDPRFLDGRLPTAFVALQPSFESGETVVMEQPVYFFGPEGASEEIARRIQAFATDAEVPTHLGHALNPTNVHHSEYVAWLELDNPFFFCRDQSLFERFVAHVRNRT